MTTAPVDGEAPGWSEAVGVGPGESDEGAVDGTAFGLRASVASGDVVATSPAADGLASGPVEAVGDPSPGTAPTTNRPAPMTAARTSGPIRFRRDIAGNDTANHEIARFDALATIASEAAHASLPAHRASSACR